MDSIPIFWKPPGLLILMSNFFGFAFVAAVLSGSPRRDPDAFFHFFLFGTCTGVVVTDLLYRWRRRASLLDMRASTIYFLPTWLLGVAGFVGSVVLFHHAGSPAFRTYDRYSSALLANRFVDARRQASGDQALRTVDEYESWLSRIGTKTFEETIGMAQRVRVEVESEVESSDGKQVTLKVVREVRRSPGVRESEGPPTERHRQEAVVVRTEAGWRMESFRDEIEELK